MSAEELGITYTAKCDEFIAANPGNKALEDAVIELELAHKHHSNAMKREFNAEIDNYTASLRKQYDTNVQADRAAFQRDVERITKDYQGQFSCARIRYQEEVQRIKDTYERILADQQHSNKLISRLYQDHKKELDRVNEEWARVIGVRDRQIEALERQIDVDVNVTNNVLDEQNAQRKEVEEEVSALRKTVLDLQLEKRKMETDFHTCLGNSTRQVDRIIRSSTTLLNEFQDRTSDLELAVSQMRAFIIDQEVTEQSVALRERVEKVDDEELKAHVEVSEARRERERAELQAVMENAQQIRTEQSEAMKNFLMMVSEERAYLVAPSLESSIIAEADSPEASAVRENYYLKSPS